MTTRSSSASTPRTLPAQRGTDCPSPELRDDLRFAADLRALGRHTREATGGRKIEGWIAQELAAGHRLPDDALLLR